MLQHDNQLANDVNAKEAIAWQEEVERLDAEYSAPAYVPDNTLSFSNF
ncbi:hypothetical protein [Motilimonas pumila]|nr:hypothetical protein [Motilimonas pumila]